MSKNQILKLVKEHAQKGVPLEELRHVFKLYGWDDSFIDEAFQSYDIPTYYEKQVMRHEFWQTKGYTIMGTSSIIIIMIFAVFWISPFNLIASTPTAAVVSETSPTINSTPQSDSQEPPAPSSMDSITIQ